MAKQTKIKRGTKMYRSSRNRNAYKAVKNIVIVMLCFALIATGFFLGGPILDYMFGESEILSESSGSSGSSSSSSESQSSESEPLVVVPELKELNLVEIAPADFFNTTTILSAVETAKAAGYNGFIVTIKDIDGNISYNTQNEFIRSFAGGAIAQNEIEPIIEILNQNDMVAVARIQAFNDNMAAAKNVSSAVMYQNSETIRWIDNYADQGGRSWLNPASDDAVRFIEEIAKEAAAAGFYAVATENINFPTGVGLSLATYPNLDGASFDAVINDINKGLTAIINDNGALHFQVVSTQGYAGNSAFRYGENIEYSGDAVVVNLSDYYYGFPYQVGVDFYEYIDGSNIEAIINSAVAANSYEGETIFISNPSLETAVDNFIGDYSSITVSVR